jgi:hypothetical protein
MSDIALAITQPMHGSAITAPVALAGSASGNTAGLFFKWFSSLNANATAAQPELNTAGHTAASLNFAGPVLGEFGSHALLLSATDQEGIDLASIKAVKRSALAGGAPPAAPAPCVVHQVTGAQFLNPASDGLTLSKASASIDVLAPGAWLKPDPAHAGQWMANPDYQAINGVQLSLRLEPDGAPAGRASADLPPLALSALPFFRQNDKTWLRVAGALPAALGTGNYRLLLKASAGTGSGVRVATVTRLVVLAA